jgi:glucose/arabinose dehydrogenase
VLFAFHGSWDRSEPTGYKVVRLPFEDGQPTGQVIDFATGWRLDDGEYCGRPVDVLLGADGSLFISDGDGRRIFRVSPTSDDRSVSATPPG